jgi:glycosyltransferase involved in cell wall biosynthesis
VHDLAFLDYPGLLPVEARRYYGQLLKALSRADRIIAVSGWTASALEARFPEVADRLVVIPNGVDDSFFVPPLDPWVLLGRTLSPSQIQSLRDRPLLLAVGTVEPRKRYHLLLATLERLHATHRGSRPLLIVVGQMGWCEDGVAAKLNWVAERGHALWLKNADDLVLRALYAVATLLVVPSLDEGFCLPAVEAMAAGLPVLAARRGALPEVLGDAGHLVDADSPDAWAAEITALIDDPIHRRVLAARGIERARRFRWDEAARRTVAVYREVLG